MDSQYVKEMYLYTVSTNNTHKLKTTTVMLSHWFISDNPVMWVHTRVASGMQL